MPVGIWKGPTPADYDAAERDYLAASEEGGPTIHEITDLFDALEARYPIPDDDDPDDDKRIWPEGLYRDHQLGRGTGLAVYDDDPEVIPFLVAEANRRGLHVLDLLTCTFYAADGTVLEWEAPEKPRPPEAGMTSSQVLLAVLLAAVAAYALYVLLHVALTIASR